MVQAYVLPVLSSPCVVFDPILGSSILFWSHTIVHIDPEQNNNATHLTEPTKRLPKGKKGVDVWGEYLGRLSSGEFPF
jgi:hypothetical protein